MMGRITGTIRATRSEGQISVLVPKVGLPTYDALRAYGAALALEALAAARNLLSFPRIRDQGAAYLVTLRTGCRVDPGEVPALLSRSHPALALLRALGSEEPERAARELGELLAGLLRNGELPRGRSWTLQAVAEPGAVKAPRGPSRAALQRRREMLGQMKRDEAEGLALAYLAAWGLVRKPTSEDRWKPGLGLFATTRQGDDFVRILPLPADVELRHERDAAALADAELWGGSEVGAACHHLVLLGLRGALGARGVLVDRLRPVRGGGWQPVSWGTVRAAAIERLAASPAGHRALRALSWVFDRARREEVWAQAAHQLSGYLVSPGIESLGRFVRAAAGALAAAGPSGGRPDLDEEAMGEVMEMTEATLSALYRDGSVQQVGRSLRRLLRESQSWQVYEGFVAARAPDDLARAINDLLREVATANRAPQRGGAGGVWVPDEAVLPALLELAERFGAEAVGLAVASYALTRGRPDEALARADVADQEALETEVRT